MREDRLRWNQKYSALDDGLPRQPASLLLRHERRLQTQTGGLALDLACGPGRNALFLSRLGFRVDAFDISEVALRQLARAARNQRLCVRPAAIDLDQITLPPGRYDVVTLFNYLNRRVLRQIGQTLAGGGLLFVETFTEADRQTAGVSMRRDYLLREGELRAVFSSLQVIDYWEGSREDSKGRKRGKASLVAKKPL